MSTLPNKPQDVNPKNPNIPLVRDKSGKFIKTGASANPIANDLNNDCNAQGGQLPVTPIYSTQAFGKENQPNFEAVYLEDAEKTKELKEQLAQLEKETEVKEISGEIELPEAVQKQGVEVTGDAVPVSTTPSITLPLDDQKIYNIVKNFKKLHQNVKDSVTWMAWWCFRQLQMVGVKLKEVHGKIVRQVE